MSSQGWTKTRLLAIATMLAVVFTAGGWIAGAQSKDQPAAPERTLRVGEVARVGQEVISAEAFVQKLLEHDNGRAPVARIGQAALIDLIGETLLEAEDKRLECRVKPHEIEKELSAYLDRMRKVWERDEKIRALPKGEEEQAWEEYLKQRVGMTEKELSAYLRPGIKRNIQKRLIVTFFEESTDRIFALMIVCKGLKDAEAAQKELKAGIDFGTVASKYSIRTSEYSGGKVGNVYRHDGRLDPKVDEALWKLEDGEVSATIESGGYYYITKRERKVTGNGAEFFDCRSILMAKPDVDPNRFEAWANVLSRNGRYAFERSVPGWDRDADGLNYYERPRK